MSSPLDQWVTDYELSLAGSGLDRGTCVSYLRGARQFVDFLDEHHPEVRSPGDISTAVFEAWMAHLHHNLGRSAATRRLRFIAVSLWCKWLMKEGDSGLTHNPTTGVRAPVPNNKPVDVVPEEHVAALLATCEGPEFIDRRDNAIIRVLYEDGLRRIELCRLDVPDVDVRQQKLRLWGKGDKHRVASFGAKTALSLSRYIRARGRHPACDAPAFFLPSRPSTSGESWRLRGGGVAQILKRRCYAAGIPYIHPHQLRHLATHGLLAAGMNDSDVEYLMGWSDPSMVRRYGAQLRAERAVDKQRKLARGDRL